MRLKYRVYMRPYLIKIKNVLANFGSENQFKVETFISLQQKLISLEKSYHFWQTHPFLNEGKVKFLQIKRDSIRQKYEKR